MQSNNNNNTNNNTIDRSTLSHSRTNSYNNNHNNNNNINSNTNNTVSKTTTPNLSRRVSRDSNTTISSQSQQSHRRIFSVIDFAKQMASNSRRSSHKNDNKNNNSNNALGGKDYRSVNDFEQQNYIQNSHKQHSIDIDNHKSNGSNNNNQQQSQQYSSYQTDDSNKPESSGTHEQNNDGSDSDSLLHKVREALPSQLGGIDNPNDPRQAYANRDVEASQRAHEIRLQNLRSGEPLEENHNNIANDYIKSIVYGGLDGIITTFATVTSVAGAHMSALVVIVLGISHLFADGLSMGLGDCLSSQAEIEYNHSERRREQWEMDNNMSGEIDEMIAIYMRKGISKDDAQNMIHTLSKYPTVFLDHMMVEELSLMPPDPDDSPVKDGMVTMGSFMLFGSIPLLPYVIAHIPWFKDILTESIQLYGSITMTVLTLFFLGAMKSTIVETGGSKWYKGGAQVAITGMLAAIIGWASGAVLSIIVPDAGNVID